MRARNASLAPGHGRGELAAVMAACSSNVTAMAGHGGEQRLDQGPLHRQQPVAAGDGRGDAVRHDLGLGRIGRLQVDVLGGGQSGPARRYPCARRSRPRRMKAGALRDPPARDRGTAAPNGAFQ